MTPEETVQSLLAKLSPLLQERRLSPHAKGRQMIAVAGPPASGKTTVAAQLAAALPDAAYVPMDGYHLDNSILTARGLLPRKGSAQSFDADGFIAMIHRLRAGHDVIAPLFNRAQDQSIAGALHIPKTTQTIVVEGNYLLFDQTPWRDLRPLWDISIWLDVPLDTLEHRLIQRWRDHGFSEIDAQTKALSNDIPNAKIILTHALPADLTL